MSDDKYYTPEPSEICFGFECEIKEGEVVWRTAKAESGNEIMYFLELLDYDCLRVKKLDRSDIEECGWFNIGDNKWEIHPMGDMYMLYWEGDEKIGIGQFPLNHTEIPILYKGRCRNKSHLRQLMKDLGI